MNKIICLPKYVFDENVNDYYLKIHNDSCFISILNPDNDEKRFSEHENFLQIRMWDVEMDVKDIITGEIYHKPQDNELEKIVEFVNNNKDKDFYIHCSAGVSRSGAVGRYIQELTGNDSKRLYQDNPNIKPNLYILKRLHQINNNEREDETKVLIIKKKKMKDLEFEIKKYIRFDENEFHKKMCEMLKVKPENLSVDYNPKEFVVFRTPDTKSYIKLRVHTEEEISENWPLVTKDLDKKIEDELIFVTFVNITTTYHGKFPNHLYEINIGVDGYVETYF